MEEGMLPAVKGGGQNQGIGASGAVFEGLAERWTNLTLFLVPILSPTPASPLSANAFIGKELRGQN